MIYFVVIKILFFRSFIDFYLVIYSEGYCWWMWLSNCLFLEGVIDSIVYGLFFSLVGLERRFGRFIKFIRLMYNIRMLSY